MLEIAEILGAPFSTLCREIRRNRQRDGAYDSDLGQEKALARRRLPRRVSKCTAENEQWVTAEITWKKASWAGREKRGAVARASRAGSDHGSDRDGLATLGGASAEGGGGA